ncbi:MAG: GGDEF domain-containing protein [Planctomycetota bacterium]
MVGETKRWFWVGSRPEVRDALTAALGSGPTDASVVDAADGDLVVVDPQADSAAMAGMPHGHAFSGVRALKLRRGVAVYVLVDTGDAIGVQLTRFTLADGVLMWNVEQQDLNTDELRSGALSQRRPSVDDLLARLQGEAGAHGQENSIQRLMRFERDDSLLTKLQDAETGLFDGHYATLKLDEEWKRSHRFHQPLSLLLLDLGFQGEISDVERRAGLAEAAGVFLNECRDIDVLARFSESVFLFLLPGTGAEGAQVLANRILGSLKERLQGQVAANSAGGLCTVPSADIANRKSFVAVAEACLTKAKAAGTGVVCSSWQ